MAEKNRKEQVFDKINALYAEYTSLIGQENIESEIQSVTTQIQIELWRVYVKDLSEDSYSDEIIKIVRACLKQYQQSYEIKFSQYACSAIKKRLNYLKEMENLKNKNGNMYISDDAFKRAKKVKKLDSDFEKSGFKDEDVRNKKIAYALEISVEDVEESKKLLNRKRISQFHKDENGEEQDILDKYINNHFPSQSQIVEFKESCQNLLSSLETELDVKKKKSPEKYDFFIKTITIDLLRKHFPQKLADKNDEKDGQFLDSRKDIKLDDNYNLESFFKEAHCFNQEIIDILFRDEKYRLPEMQSLAAEVGHEKSAITKELSRFYDKVIETFEKNYGEKEFAESFLKK